MSVFLSRKALFIILTSVLWLSACGQKGPLYLPVDPSAQQATDEYAEDATEASEQKENDEEAAED